MALASASWIDVGATSHGLTGAVSPFGKVTNLRPLRRLIWIGTDKVSLPSLVAAGCPARRFSGCGYRSCQRPPLLVGRLGAQFQHQAFDAMARSRTSRSLGDTITFSTSSFTIRVCSPGTVDPKSRRAGSWPR